MCICIRTMYEPRPTCKHMPRHACIHMCTLEGEGAQLAPVHAYACMHMCTLEGEEAKWRCKLTIVFALGEVLQLDVGERLWRHRQVTVKDIELL